MVAATFLAWLKLAIMMLVLVLALTAILTVKRLGVALSLLKMISVMSSVSSKYVVMTKARAFDAPKAVLRKAAMELATVTATLQNATMIIVTVYVEQTASLQCRGITTATSHATQKVAIGILGTAVYARMS
mmetsp:Transcript_4934/g.9246  ORF Transcript_4934/g.9246 Transcript_4934/m.9246 type:complete len:131 (-) Transcript_4934:229-621(-)